jgi:hypothetical protein
MIVPMSFENFTRLLSENRGKPIYKKNDEEKKFDLVWTASPFSGFYYYCGVSFDEIYLAYMRQHKDWNPIKSIDLFVNTYLLNCVQFGTETKDIPMLGMMLTTPVPYAKEVSPTGHMTTAVWEMSEKRSIKDFEMSSFKMEKVSASKKLITGKVKGSKLRDVFAAITKRKVKASDISFEKPGTPETRQGMLEERPSKPASQIPSVPETLAADELPREEMEKMEELEKLLTPPLPKTASLERRVKEHYQIIKEDSGLALVESKTGLKIIDLETGRDIQEKSEKPMTPEEIEERVEDEMEAYPNPSEDQEGWIRRKIKKRKPHGILEHMDDDDEKRTIAKGGKKAKGKSVRNTNRS